MEDVVSRSDAVAAGHPPATVDRLLRDGSWTPIRRGIYAAGVGRTPATDAVAAVRSLGDDVVASHETAAQLLGLPLLADPGGVSVTRPTGSTRYLSGLRVHVAALPDEHVDTVDGLRVTTPARTVVDLARRLPRQEALVVADAALHLRRARPEDLDEVLARCSTWPGIRRAGWMRRHADGRAESPLETVCRELFLRHGLPAPVPQAVVADGSDGWYARVDFLWPESRTVVEADGRTKYGAAADLWNEKLRQERIEELGYLVRRVSWGQVARQPEATVARVRAALTRHRAN
jgi:hypothetical protein